MVSCFIKIQIGLTFLVLAYPGCIGKEAIKRVSILSGYYMTSFNNRLIATEDTEACKAGHLLRHGVQRHGNLNVDKLGT